MVELETLKIIGITAEEGEEEEMDLDGEEGEEEDEEIL